MERLSAVALKGTALAQATAGTIRLRLCKLAARVEVSVRRLRVRLAPPVPGPGLTRGRAAPPAGADTASGPRERAHPSGKTASRTHALPAHAFRV
jgi:hypothetical protein